MATEVTVTFRFREELPELSSWYDIIEGLVYLAEQEVPEDWEIVDIEEV